MAEKRWIAETLFDAFGIRMTFAVERVLHETRDEFIYHEMMTHVPIFAHGRAREVLIVGGGDCGIAEEVLKHASVARLTQVEIDPSVVEFSKEHFPEFTKPVLRD